MKPVNFEIANFVTVDDNKNLSMSSLQIVELINLLRDEQGSILLHKNFLAKVPQVLGNHSAEFLAEYKDSIGRSLKSYNLPKRETMLMLMSYSYDVQAIVYDKMCEYEEQIRNKVPTSFAQALLLAAEQAAKIEKQEKMLLEAKPKVDFVDNYVDTTGLKNVTQVAKELGISAKRLGGWLREQGYAFKKHVPMVWKQDFVDKDYGSHKHQNVWNVEKQRYVDGTVAMFTPKGDVFIKEKYNEFMKLIKA